MDTAHVALIVAGITTLGGITQATLAGRATRVAARQQAVQAEIALLVKLQDQLADLGQAANDYGLEMFEEDFFHDRGWADKRRPVLQRLTTCHGRVFGTAYSLPPEHPAREAALTACDVAVAIATHNDEEDKPRSQNEAWKRDSHKIRMAIETTGAAVRTEYLRLQDVTRNGLSRSWRRMLGRRRRHTAHAALLVLTLGLFAGTISDADAPIMIGDPAGAVERHVPTG